VLEYHKQQRAAEKRKRLEQALEKERQAKAVVERRELTTKVLDQVPRDYSQGVYTVLQKQDDTVKQYKSHLS